MYHRTWVENGELRYLDIWKTAHPWAMMLHATFDGDSSSPRLWSLLLYEEDAVGIRLDLEEERPCSDRNTT